MHLSTKTKLLNKIQTESLFTGLTALTVGKMSKLPVHVICNHQVKPKEGSIVPEFYRKGGAGGFERWCFSVESMNEQEKVLHDRMVTIWNKLY